jgi:Sap, sulfolipid-1-addressing protein
MGTRRARGTSGTRFASYHWDGARAPTSLPPLGRSMTIAGVLLLALIDSINPSAIVVTLYLLSTTGQRALAPVGVYVGAIFTTYLLLGVTMVLGIGSLLPSLGGVLDGVTGILVQTLFGLALLVYSLRASTHREAPPAIAPPSASTYAALAMLGVTVTVMEIPTALPYLAAIGLISEAGLPLRVWAPLLGIYNVIFVLPPILLLTGHLVLKGRLTEWYAALGQRLERGARETALWIAGLVGGALFATGTIDLVARLR